VLEYSMTKTCKQCKDRAALILGLDTTWREIVVLISQLLYAWEISNYLLDVRLARLHR
jgi:hypothetical protein